MLMRRVRTAAMALALCAATLTSTTVVASPAQAYDGCWGAPGAVTDYRGDVYGTRWCNAYTGGYTQFNGVASGYLYAGNSWFVCQQKFPGINNPPVGSAQNDWWLFTQADTGSYPYYGWGWFPATKISGGGNFDPVPYLRDCGSIPVFPHPGP